MHRDLDGLFAPKSIAIVGASKSSDKVGAITLRNIIDSGYQGRVYPVNPNEIDINGLRCYSSTTDIEEIPDLVVIAVPSSSVAEVLISAGEKGVKNILIFTAGYKEAGVEGDILEIQLKDIADKYEMNILGPNCLGFANNEVPVNVTFGQIVKQTGNLRVISQSGALATSLFDWCQTIGLGFSQFITVGNKAVINENDILQYWLDHPTPKVANQKGISSISPIGLYLESISDGKKFISLATRFSLENPIFILKPGKSKAAAKAMHSHTGSIAGEDSVLEAALQQAGIIRCQELGDFFDVARTLAWEDAPAGPKVAVISNAGGPAVLSTDSLSMAGLELAEFSAETHQKLVKSLPRMAGLLNPVDVLGDALADRFGNALEVVLQEKTVDSILIILTPQLMTQIEKTANTIGDLSSKYSKPVLCSFIGGELTTAGETVLNSYRIPSFPFPERAIKTLALMWQWQNWKNNQKLNATVTPTIINLDSEKITTLLQTARTNGQKALDNSQANELILATGIQAPPTSKVENLSQAINQSQEMGWPVVLKISSSKILHKTEVGGVITDIRNEVELTMAWSQLASKIDLVDKGIKDSVSIQLQKQITQGIEVIIGVRRDPIFGSVLLFGAGGKLAELIADRNLMLLPLDLNKVISLVSHSKVNKLLSGFRGDKPYELEPLYDLILRLGKVVENNSEISEIEINPLIITHEGAWAVDTKVILV